ncbi:MAG TPA: bifunctional phosphoglucose/phosphomannose isomerase [Bacteroidia bacterium]|nr:bifunctional phosphoglucose/phosphomannose isomerase [Bacteroidia bacterium]
MMKDLIQRFPAQLKEAVKIANNAKLSALKAPINKVVICGLGGSGIGGTIAKEILFDEATAPIEVLKSYTLPSYIDEHTLVICSSYSGNTEETLECYHLAQKQKAKIVCITSGGTILELAKKDGNDAIVVPGGSPPRSCLGYSLTQLLHILSHYKIAPQKAVAIAEAAEILEKTQESIMQEAHQIADRLLGKMPVIYCTALHEGIAIRLRQQFNENAKVLCWHHVVPEMNHNELVGWSHPYSEIAVILFTDKDENPRNKLRLDFCRKVFGKYAAEIIEIPSKGENTIEKKLYWIHLGDWVSMFLSEKRNVDAMDIKVIDSLKSELASK